LLRIELQEIGENLNTWGKTRLNNALQRLEEGIADVVSIAITGATYTVTSTNYVADEARAAVLVLTGALGANTEIVPPTVKKTYLIVNNTTPGTFSLTIKTAAGAGYALLPGPQRVYCDGVGFYRGTPSLDELPKAQAAVDLNSQKITGLAAGTVSADAVNKGQMETAIANAAAGGSPTAGAVRVTASDTTAQFLDGAVEAVAPLVKEVQSPGADETLRLTISAATDTAPGVVEIATQAEVNTGTDAARVVTPATLTGRALLQGRHTIPVPAGAMTARTTNGASHGLTETPGNKIMVRSWDFDHVTQQHVQFAYPMPESWDGGPLTALLYWDTAGTSGGVTFGIQGVAISDGDPLDAAFGTAVTIDDTVTAANRNQSTAETAPFTVAGSAQPGDRVIFQVYRDVAAGNDTLAAPAKLTDVLLFPNYDKGNDA
jgi:hypothetical protein